MATPAGTGSHSPFPVAPADVPIAAVRAVKRTLLRGLGADYPDIEDPMDDELARLVVAVVIAALAPFEHTGMGVCNKGRIHDGPCDYGHGV